MQFKVVALFAAGAIAGVIPDDSYVEPTAAPSVPATTEGSSPEQPSTVLETNVTEPAAETSTACEGEETVAPTVAPSEPAYEEPSEAPSAPVESSAAPSVPASSGLPATSEASSPEQSECVPNVSEKTITTSYTTVIPTTIVETYTEACPEPTEGEGEYPEPTGTGVAPGTPEPTEGEGEYPEPTGPAGNGTTPEEPVTAGAGSIVGSVFTAAVAGLAAYAFA